MDVQQMSGLEILEAPDDFDPIFASILLQRAVQERADQQGRRILSSPDGAKSLGELAVLVKENSFRLINELMELVDDLPWKDWKTNYGDKGPEIRLEDVPDLVAEKVFEAVDAWHFLNNVFIALGVDYETALNIYYTKFTENMRRQASGY